MGSAYGGKWRPNPNKPEDQRFLGTPGEIKTTFKNGYRIDTKIGEDGRAVRERHLVEGPLGIAYQALFSAIANYTLSITYLAISGMDLQANVLLRNLYELIFLFLAITINDDLQNKFLKNTNFEEMDIQWYKHLRYKKLQKIVQCWEEKQPIKLADVLNEDQDVTYKQLSAMAHSQYVPILTFSFTKANNPDDIIMPNVWGNPATRTESILGVLHSILSYTNISFFALLEEKNQTLTNKLHLLELARNDDIGKRFSFFMNLSNWFYSYHYLSPIINTACPPVNH